MYRYEPRLIFKDAKPEVEKKELETRKSARRLEEP